MVSSCPSVSGGEHRTTLRRNWGLKAAQTRHPPLVHCALEAAIAQLEVQERGLRGILPRLLLLEVEYVLALRQAELVWVRSFVEDLRTGQISWDIEQLLAVLGGPALRSERGGSMS